MSHIQEPVEAYTAARISALKRHCDTVNQVISEVREAVGATDAHSTADEVRRIVAQRDNLLAAARNVRDVRGRYNSEIANTRLFELIDEMELSK